MERGVERIEVLLSCEAAKLDAMRAAKERGAALGRDNEAEVSFTL